MQRSAINRLRSLPAKKASFVEPMECLSVARLPEGSQWLWEIKLDGYRALAVKSGSAVTLFSRRGKTLNRQFPHIVERLADLPDGTVVDGELVAIDDSGHPDFHLLQNFRERYVKCRFYVVGGAGIPRAAHRAACVCFQRSGSQASRSHARHQGRFTSNCM